ncbi:MAG: DUF2442 domain-containing protein [Flavobacteriales bacterium]|nr:DUF2442 domain-containing protein [Flavobacteriales bacterium]
MSSRKQTATSAAKPIGLDPIEAMVLKEGLRIVDVLPYKDLDLLAVVLNSGDVLQARLSDFDRLKKASEAQLKKWRLIGGGMGINWDTLDEDLSLRGFIRDSVQHEALRRMTVRRSKTTVKSR